MVRTEAATGIISKDWAVFLIAVAVIVLDQVSKFLVRVYFQPAQSIPENWPVRFTYYTNTGAAFGLFPNQTILFIVVAIAAIALIAVYYRRLPSDGNIIRIGLGLQLGGAIGNLTDRLIFGQVTDFIDVGFWPVFNFADSSIVVGVGLLAYFLLFYTPKQPETTKQEPTQEPSEQ